MKITKFKLLKKCHQDNLKDKMTAVLGFYSHDSKGDLNYLTVFNEDLKALNRFVEIPPSGNDVENEYQQALADRDMAYERAQTRWQQSEQDLHVGVTFMKELIFYEQNLKEIQTKRAIHLERMSEIESYLTSDDQDLELKRWRKQGNLAFMNTADILAFKDRLDTLHVLLDLFESKKWGSDPVGIEITEVIKFNRQLLNHYYQQTIEAMLYRVEAATEFGNIYYDDAYNLLKRKMGMELTTAGHSYEMSPKKYSECIRYIKRSNLKNIKKRLTEILKKWEDNKEHRFPLKMIDHELVPLALFSDTRKAGPSQSSSDKYFKSDNGEIGYKPLLRKYLIGSYDNQALYINKALQQITWFNEQVSIWESKKQSISLEKLKYVMAFRWAIDVHDILKNEIARCDSARSSILLKASNLKHEQDRLNRWKVILENAKSEIESKCSNIARFVLKDYQTLLFYSMKNRTFILSRQSIDFLKKFFELYADKKSLSTYREVSSPLNMILQYDFFKSDDSKSIRRTIDQDAIYGFHYFSEKYWGAEYLSAIESVLNLIERKDIPDTQGSLDALYKKISVILDPKDPKASFENLMNAVANKIYYFLGDDGTPNMLWFMQRYAKDTATAFKLDREINGNKKYIFLISLFSRQEGQEYDLKSEDQYPVQRVPFHFNLYDKYVRDIYHNHSSVSENYRAKLKEKAKKYLSEYNGSNLAYFDLIRLASLTFLSSADYINYVLRHFRWILDHSSEENPYPIDDEMSEHYAKMLLNQDVRNAIIGLIDNPDNDCMGLASIVGMINHPEISSAFYAARLRCHLKNSDYSTILQCREDYNQLLSKSSFSERVEGIIDFHLRSILEQNNEEEIRSDSLSLIVEFLGSNRNKQQYRLLRFIRLIYDADYYQTAQYLQQLADCYRGKEMVFFSFNTSREVLRDTFESYLSEHLAPPAWDGHTQFMLEEFSPIEARCLLDELRMRWLRLYLFSYKKFETLGELNSKPLDIRSNEFNLEIPTTQNSLAQFYSAENLPEIRELILERLDLFDLDLPPQVLNLIEKYINDPAIKHDQHYVTILGKLETYQTVLEIGRFTGSGVLSNSAQKAFDVMQTQVEVEKETPSVVSEHRELFFGKVSKKMNSNRQHLENLQETFKRNILRLLRDKNPIGKVRYLQEDNVNNLTQIMEQLSNQDKIHIQNALLAYIDNLYDNFSQVQEKRDWSDWEAASRLFHALELDIEDKIKVHSERSKELIVSIRKEMANRINTCTMNASVENLQKQENELLCHIVFIKKFGSKKVNDEYERIIDDVLKEWNEAVKDKTTGPLFDHSFAFAKKLISLAGSNQQKEECVNLNQGWRVTAKRSRLRAC